MGGVKILHNHNPSHAIGRFDPETRELVFKDGIVISQEGLTLVPGYEILESDVIDGVRVVKKVRLHEVSICDLLSGKRQV